VKTLDLQKIVSIASKYDTAMSHAMLDACRAKANTMGVSLVVAPTALQKLCRRRKRPDPYELTEEEWRRMVERNSDTHWNHC